MRRSNSCSTPITVRNPDVAQLAPGFNLVNISKAWQYSTGNGVPVAVIDTGVSPNPRLPVVPGGDYIMGEDGLSDCDAHGTVVSSIIAAAPLGILPMPRAMPATAAFPPPAGPPPVTAASAPLGSAIGGAESVRPAGAGDIAGLGQGRAGGGAALGGGGMGMPMGAAHQGQGGAKSKGSQQEDEALYTEDRAWTEAVIGNRRRQDSKESK